MVMKVLIIGGYGNFGSYIARSLAGDDAIQLLIGGRSRDKAEAFVATLKTARPAEGVAIDISSDVYAAISRINPNLVIHTTGPFQSQDYAVAEACIKHGCHYLDLADARRFVADIGKLDTSARARDVLVVSGASSVPCLTAAVIDHYLPLFGHLDSIDYGISAAQQTNRGLATTEAVLSYVGKPIAMLKNGQQQLSYGWQDMHAETYPEIGTRLFGNCEVPDLDLFPARYPSLRSQRFSAGHELKVLHVGTWLLSWLVRIGLVRSLADHARQLLRFAFLFDRLGSGRSGFHMYLSGLGIEGQPLQKRFFLIAKSGHGPNIPCMPAILLAKRLARHELSQRGAMPCLDLIALADYLAALKGLDISVVMDGADA
jgi:Saccharopine dehydrogenase NADP binding domain